MIRRTACLIARDNEPCRNLAIEKHLMDTLPENTAILYLYQNRHAIVVGRNQNPWQECKVESFLQSGGGIARRLSGGGASYQDMGCLNYTFILPKTDFSIPGQLSIVAAALGSLGAPVQPGPKSGLYVGGRLLCQNDYFKAGSTAFHHGVLFFDASVDVMEHYLRPRSKQPENPEAPNFKQRMLNLRQLNPEATLDGAERALCEAFAFYYHSSPAWLDEKMMDESSIEKTASQFENPQWVYPEKADYDFTVQERFPWGDVTVLLKREGGVIRAAKIFSDAMEAALFLRMEQGLIGCPFLIGAITTRFEQKLELLRDVRLLQIAADVNTLICGRIRAMDRGGEGA